jgi:N-acetylglucosamine-6-phosphate deacetylase
MISTSSSPSRAGNGITKFTNCRLLKGSDFVYEDLWISSRTGCILNGQEVFFKYRAAPERVVDLGGRIIAPGFIDVQLNGGFGFDFSVVPEDAATYPDELRRMNKSLVKTGVTSYLPTVTSQKPEVYEKVLHHLAPSGASRRPSKGSESLGAHIEGPFLSPTKNGIHSSAVLRSAPNGFSDLEACYGASNFALNDAGRASTVKLITLAPELPGMMSLIPQLVSRGVTVSIGHSEASYEQGSDALALGATMITHLFNAMRPLHHRNPGLFGLLGLAPEMPPIHQSSYLNGNTMEQSCLTSPRHSPTSPLTNTPPDSPTLGSDGGKDSAQKSEAPVPVVLPPAVVGQAPAQQTPRPQRHASKPFFGLIADGVHLHPRTIALAAHAHGSGVVLVTDAMALAGLPDGTYNWTGGSSILKRGTRLTLAESDERADRIAGSAVTLIECVNNFIDWAGVGVARALQAVTETPARLIGMEHVKGSLASGADADLVILDEADGEAGRREVRIDQVWKFGECVYEKA